MKRRLIILSVVSTLLLTACITAIFLTGLTVRLNSGEKKKTQPVQIAQVAPLTLSAGGTTAQSAVKSPPGLVAASVKQPPVVVVPTINTITASGPTSTPTLPAPARPTATPSPSAAMPPPPLPVAPIVAQSGSDTRLVIPKLSLDTPILYAPVENGTWKVDHLYQAVGYLEGTAPPGADSNFVVAGHVTLDVGVYGPFANLGSLTPGDLIIVHQGGKEILYLVSNTYAVDKKSVEVVYPSETGEITLITCVNWSNDQGRYVDRLVVKGRLIKG